MSVERDLNVISIGGTLNVAAIRQCVRECRLAIEAGFEDITFDLYETSSAYPDGTTSLVALSDWLASRNVEVSLELPDDERIATLLDNIGLPSLIAPERFPPHERLVDRHLGIVRFDNHRTQFDAVNQVLDIAIRYLDFSRDELYALEWSINELADNVLIHAATSRGGLLQLSTLVETRRLVATIADSGIGIPASLTDAYPVLKTDVERLTEAAKEGVTRGVGQGFGLTGALQVATLSGGSLSVYSGGAFLLALPRGVRSEPRNGRDAYPGCTVTTTIDFSNRLDLEKALNLDSGAERRTYFDIKYSPDAENVIEIPMSTEAGSFGSRESGRVFATHIMNILCAHPESTVRLDWSLVPLVTSGFADEAVAKVVHQLGVEAYFVRVQHVGMDSLVEKLLARAIERRLQQESANG